MNTDFVTAWTVLVSLEDGTAVGDRPASQGAGQAGRGRRSVLVPPIRDGWLCR